MNLSSKKSTRSNLTIVLAVSLGLHLIALVIFGTLKIVEAVIREEQTFEAPPIEQIQEEPEYVVNLEQRNQDSSPPRPNPITVDSPDVTIPALNIDINVANSSSYGRGTGGFGTGAMSMTMREMATATLFGMEISATKLGVILDVSRSTHDKINLVVDEIDRNFKDAIIILIPNCAAGQGNFEMFPLSEYGQAEEKFPAKDRYSTASNVNRMIGRNPDFERFYEKIERQDRGYIFFPEGSKQSHVGGAVGQAVDFLREQEVDTVYWFADFNDDISNDAADEMLSSLRRGRMTLFVHDFVAPLGASKERRNNDEKLADLTARTNGKFFLEELN